MMKKQILIIEIELKNIEENISTLEKDINNIMIRIESSLSNEGLNSVSEEEAWVDNYLFARRARRESRK